MTPSSAVPTMRPEIDTSWKEMLWQQFGASIDMLENAVDACPDQLWGDQSRHPQFQFWYMVFHTLFWLDLDLSGNTKGFAPPAPFTLEELDPAGAYPDRVYTKHELKTYLAHDRNKCREAIRGLTEARARERVIVPNADMPFLELLLYNMRHIQHHTAQLNWMLRLTIDSVPRYVRKTASPLGAE